MYEVLDHDATLETVDPKGEKAVLTHREAVHFLQDDLVDIHYQARGDRKATRNLGAFVSADNMGYIK